MSSLNAQDLKWVTDIGGNSQIIVRALDVGNNGDIYTVGSFEGTQDFDPYSGITNLSPIGISDVFIQRTDSLGRLIWVRNIGSVGASSSSNYGSDIKAADDGSLYLIGFYRDSLDFDPSTSRSVLIAEGRDDAYIAKYDTAGNFIWANGFYGVDNSRAQTLEIDNSGNLIVSGTYSYHLSYGAVNSADSISSLHRRDVFVTKINPQGNWIWGKGFGGNNSTYISSIEYDTDNNIYVGGSFDNTTDFDPSSSVFSKTAKGSSDVYINKLDSNGNFVWVKTLKSSSYAEGGDLVCNDSSAIYMSGFFADTLDMNPDSTNYPLFSTGNFDAFILKLNLQGDFIWAKSIYSVNGSYAYRMVLNDDEDVLISGDFYGTADFDPDSSSTFNLTSQGGIDIFFLKLSKSGRLVSATSIGGSDWERMTDMEMSVNNELVYTGTYSSSLLDFDPGLGVTNVSTNGQFNIYTLKLADTPLSVGIKKIAEEESINYVIYPNPSSGIFTINNRFQDKFRIEVYSNTGNLIKNELLSKENTIDLRSYSKGIYFYRLIGVKGNKESGKLIVK